MGGYWTGGFVYDHCPSTGSTCIATRNGETDWWPNAGWSESGKIAAKCGTSDAKQACVDGGYIISPEASGTCAQWYVQLNSADQPKCWPNWNRDQRCSNSVATLSNRTL